MELPTEMRSAMTDCQIVMLFPMLAGPTARPISVVMVLWTIWRNVMLVIKMQTLPMPADHGANSRDVVTELWILLWESNVMVVQVVDRTASSCVGTEDLIHLSFVTMASATRIFSRHVAERTALSPAAVMVSLTRMRNVIMDL